MIRVERPAQRQSRDALYNTTNGQKRHLQSCSIRLETWLRNFPIRARNRSATPLAAGDSSRCQARRKSLTAPASSYR
jgi:hypothetical protein